MSEEPFLILVADDEPKYAQLIRLNLEARGYEVLVAYDGYATIELALAHPPDLVILDVRMPKLDGYETCERIREFSNVPIIMLTALAEDTDKIKGLNLGADDYVTKPFNIDVLIARIRAALRRSNLKSKDSPDLVFQAGDLRIEMDQQRVFRGQQEIPLTPTEHQLLEELVHQAGRVVLSDILLERIWGTSYLGDYRVLRQAIYRLRQKLEPAPQDPQYIQTRPGLGYMFVFPE